MLYIVQKLIPGKRPTWTDWYTFGNSVSAYGLCARMRASGQRVRVRTAQGA